VNPLSTEKLFSTVYCDTFALIDNFPTTVITLTRQSLSIFISQYGSCCFHHLFTYKAFGGNQLYAFFLAFQLVSYKIKDYLISFHVLNIIIRLKFCFKRQIYLKINEFIRFSLAFIGYVQARIVLSQRLIAC